MLRWLQRLEGDPQPLAYGRMHGDWIPDNLGQVDSTLAVWDWEHSWDHVPVGFDLLHWHFHHALIRHDLFAAVTAVEGARERLGVFDVPSETRRLVASAYLPELFVRLTRLAIGGGGWNAKWYPAVVEVARRLSKEWAGDPPARQPRAASTSANTRSSRGRSTSGEYRFS